MANLMGCHPAATRKSNKQKTGDKHLTIALAGNANVGKSVIFNQLTGSHQIIGNWPGKTVERAEGSLHFEGYDITIVDLPGIYSLSTFSMEELVARDYIASEKPDVVINTVDISVLERNLFFTLQLKEMAVPLVVCINQMDVAQKKGISIDTRKLEAALGVPVVPTAAIKGEGLRELIKTAIEVAEHRHNSHQTVIPFADGVENSVAQLARLIDSESALGGLGYSPRWVAIKLLENDTAIKEQVAEQSGRVINLSDKLAAEIEQVHKEPSFAVFAAARYELASKIAGDVHKRNLAKVTFLDRMEGIATNKFSGYPTSAVVLAGLLLWTFVVGSYFSGLLSNAFSFFQPVDPRVSGPLLGILWNGVFGGLVAGVTLVIPFVVPFYLMLAMMEDSGILTRVAFMMDSAMHHLGLHGKAIIPLILGYGCNVPAIQSSRIMETRRERLLAAFAITFTPCAARTIIILGLVAVFVGTYWALALYGIGLLVMLVLAKVALKVVPGKLTGLIMEMHSFKIPSFSVVARQTWTRTKSLITLVFPMYMAGTAAVQGLYALGILEPINNIMSPLTVTWLGLPAIAGILLIFGVVRKELILLTLVAIYGANLALVLTPVQFVVLALVGMMYVPCIATIAILAKEFSWKAATVISLANLAAALLVGGLAYRLLMPVMG